MDTSILADRRVREWFLMEKVLKDLEKSGEVAVLHPERAVVTISREYGAGGHTVATRVTEILGPEWQIWDKQIVDEIATNTHVRKEMVEALDEHAHSTIDDIMRSVFNYFPLSHEQYYKTLVVTLVSLSEQGNRVIVGRGATFILPNALNVRLVASIPYRIEAIERREAISHAEAAAKLRRIDTERAAYIRQVFGRNIDDPSAYDLVLNIDGISLETAAAAISAAVRQHMSEPKTQNILRSPAELATASR